MKFHIYMAALMATVLHSAQAGDIQGTVTDQDGNPLEKVLVCLQLSDQQSDCYKTRATNKKGEYSFKGLKGGQQYFIVISSGTSLAARKANPYPNYVWSPLQRTANLANQNDSIGDQNFEGIFNFSNFQQELQLTAVEFPELARYDTAADLVYLKLFSQDQSGNENLIFLGQVIDPQTLQIDVSVPQAATELYYEIYSWDQPNPVQGTIGLTAI